MSSPCSSFLDGRSSSVPAVNVCHADSRTERGPPSTPWARRGWWLSAPSVAVVAVPPLPLLPLQLPAHDYLQCVCTPLTHHPAPLPQCEDGRPLSSRDRRKLLDLESKLKLLQRRERHLEMAEKNCCTRVGSALQPLKVRPRSPLLVLYPSAISRKLKQVNRSSTQDTHTHNLPQTQMPARWWRCFYVSWWWKAACVLSRGRGCVRLAAMNGR